MVGGRAGKRLTYVTMAEIALRVRLIGGDHVDVTYSDDDAAADELVQHVISTLRPWQKMAGHCAASTATGS